MTKPLLRGSAATAIALLAASLILPPHSTIAEPLTPASQDSSLQQKNDPTGAATAVHETTPVDSVNAEAPSWLTKREARTGDKSNPHQTPKAIQTPVTNHADAHLTASVLTFPQSFTATAYNLRGRTASGQAVSRGLIAADRRVLPLGTRVRLEAGAYSGDYTVADTGGAVRGRKIDIWMPGGSEARRFGRRSVKLTVLSVPRKPNATRARSSH